MQPIRRVPMPLLLAPVLGLVPGCVVGDIAESLFHGDRRVVYERPFEAPPSSPHHPPMLLILLDGVGRTILYDMLDRGELPALARLLSSEQGDYSHAFFAEDLLTTLPSSTVPAWVTALTGKTPAQHGVSGNEYFLRENEQFVAPIPVSLSEVAPVLACFNDGYLNQQCAAPTVYQQMRERDPNVLIWVAAHPLYAGADMLLLKDRKIVADAFQGMIHDHLVEADDDDDERDRRTLYAELDEETVESLIEELERDDGPVADMITLYLSGTDQFGHVAASGPEPAIRTYLKEIVDPLLEDLRSALEARNALSSRFVVVLADHGHTEVKRDDEHSLGMSKESDPPAVVVKAGYRPRPFEYTLDEDEEFDAVLAYQGAISYIYVANRASHGAHGLDWSLPPRFDEDIVPLAEAFYQNNLDGNLVPQLRGALDMVLVRRPVSLFDDDELFEVYTGAGSTLLLDAYLQQHPHDEYVMLEQRMRDLTEGPYGERAGDVLLIARNGDCASPSERFYFAATYRSWHGSPSAQDSEIPFIVSHPRYSKERLASIVRPLLGDAPRIQQVTPVLLALRYGETPAGLPAEN